MAQTGRASLVVMLLLLVSVGIASAECAWVLWMQTVYDSGPGDLLYWSIVEATDSKARCDNYMKAQPSYQSRKGVDPKGVTYTHRYICLPDTVDPRGPKGGGR